MKAIIMEVEDKYAIIMKNNGEFIRISNNGELKVGDELDDKLFAKELNIATGSRIITKLASIAAVFILIFGLGYGAYSYNAPYAYISLDINPSIEISVNVFDRIISLKGVNNDGKILADLHNYRNMKVDEGIKNVIHSAVQQGYIKAEIDNMVFMTLSSKDANKTNELDRTIGISASEEIQSSGVEVKLYIEDNSIQNHKDAEKLGISPGKLVLIKKLKENEPQIDLQNYIDIPVKEIIKSITENEKEEIFQNRMSKDKEIPKENKSKENKSNENKSKENENNENKSNESKNNENKGNKNNKSKNENKNNKIIDVQEDTIDSIDSNQGIKEDKDKSKNNQNQLENNKNGSLNDEDEIVKDKNDNKNTSKNTSKNTNKDIDKENDIDVDVEKEKDKGIEKGKDKDRDNEKDKQGNIGNNKDASKNNTSKDKNTSKGNKSKDKDTSKDNMNKDNSNKYK